MSREDKHFRLRLPQVIKDKIAEASASARRSMTGEIIFQLERVYGLQQAATGAGFADTTPAAARNTTACQGRDIINPA